jgi:beta-lactamase superfamily II metal-dependent hydrolase
VLVLPHHGRANANAHALLARVRPRACLASAATADGETRLGPLVRRFGAELWTTGVHGTITMSGAPPHCTGEVPGRPLPRPAEPR